MNKIITSRRDFLKNSLVFGAGTLVVGPLAKWSPRAKTIVDVLTSRLRDHHPQVRQYAIKALRQYGFLAKDALSDLRDIMDNPKEKEYNRHGSSVAIEAIEDAIRLAQEQAVARCQRCGRPVSPEEYERSRSAFQRVFCDACFDEVYLPEFDVYIEYYFAEDHT